MPLLNHFDQAKAKIVPKIQNIVAATNACDEVWLPVNPRASINPKMTNI
jgi:hypothetical protein